MTRQHTVVRRAPGKLFVAGEYAVVEPGNQAILVAVDRHITVTVSGRGSGVGGADVVISSDLVPEQGRWRWHNGRLSGCGPVPGGLKHVVSAIEVMGRLLAGRGLSPPSLSVSVSSRLHDEGTKFGLGSSGAVVVATVEAVAALHNLELPPDTRFRLAMLATAGIDSRASGGDLAAGTWGGWIAYRAPDRAAVLDLARRRGIEEALRAPWPGFEVRRLPPLPPGLALEVGWTGEPASTTSLVSGLDRRTWRGGASHRRFMETTTDCVRASITALRLGDGPGLVHQIRRARRELARLDDELGLGIFTPGLTALCDAAEAVGGAAKPSGAGGGDCGIALLDAEALADISLVRERWAAAGIRPLLVRPIMEGNEK